MQLLQLLQTIREPENLLNMLILLNAAYIRAVDRDICPLRWIVLGFRDTTRKHSSHRFVSLDQLVAQVRRS